MALCAAGRSSSSALSKQRIVLIHIGSDVMVPCCPPVVSEECVEFLMHLQWDLINPAGLYMYPRPQECVSTHKHHHTESHCQFKSELNFLFGDGFIPLDLTQWTIESESWTLSDPLSGMEKISLLFGVQGVFVMLQTGWKQASKCSWKRRAQNRAAD